MIVLLYKCAGSFARCPKRAQIVCACVCVVRSKALLVLMTVGYIVYVVLLDVFPGLLRECGVCVNGDRRVCVTEEGSLYSAVYLLRSLS